MEPGSSMLRGDVLARHQLQTFALQGTPLRCMLALCSLATEPRLSASGLPSPQRHLPIKVAYAVWSYIEKGVRAYETCVRSIPNWLPAFCPVALADRNGNGRIRAAQLLLGVAADFEDLGAALPPATRHRVVLDQARAQLSTALTFEDRYGWQLPVYTELPNCLPSLV